MCPVCVSVLLSHTVLSELYQEKLVTEDEVKRMKGEGEFLSYRVVLVQCTKPPEVVARSVNMLDKYGRNVEPNQLRGWWCRQTTQQWTQCNSWASPPYTSLDYCWWPHLTHAVWGIMVHCTLTYGSSVCVYMCMCICTVRVLYIMYICVCCVCVVGDIILFQIHNFTQVHKCILHKS